MMMASANTSPPGLITASLLGAVLVLLLDPAATSAQNRAELRAPSAFSSISESQARSRALFYRSRDGDHASALYELPSRQR
jgi:hypothetical protein